MEHELTRVYFYVNKRLNISSWNATHHNPDLCHIHLNIPRIGKLHVHNIYNPVASSNSHLGQLPKLEQVIASFPSQEHIILGDFNLHHPVWGGIEARNDNNAENLLALVEQHGLHLLLKPGTVTYDEAGCQSTIDLIFCFHTIFSSLISCHIPNDSEYGSDHRPILSIFNLETIEQPAILRRQFKKTDLKVMREVMLRESARMSNLPLHTKDDVDGFVEKLVSIINKSIEASTPIQKITTWSKPGFNSECREAQMRARQLRKRFNRIGSDDAWENYRLARLEAGYIIRKACRKAYKESRERACESPESMCVAPPIQGTWTTSVLLGWWSVSCFFSFSS